MFTELAIGDEIHKLLNTLQAQMWCSPQIQLLFPPKTLKTFADVSFESDCMKNVCSY
jgi:hypothetical protein